MITLSNGHSFNFMAASGALAFDGRGWPWEWPLRWVGRLDPSLFTIVTKTLTRHPRRGNLRWYNPLRVVRPLAGGAVNAVGLTNPGIDWWCREIAPQLRRSGRKLILSLEAEGPDEVKEMVRRTETLREVLFGIELNCSCPNSFSEGERSTERTVAIVQAAKLETSLPLILKLGVTHEFLVIAKQLEGTVEALAINSVPWSVIFPGRRSPLERFGGGGVSGKIAQPWTWEMARTLSQRSAIPVIGPSPWGYGDIRKLFDLGVKAVSFGSLFLWYPWRPTRFVRRWQSESARAPIP